MAEQLLRDMIVKLTGRTVLYTDDVKNKSIMVVILDQGRRIMRDAGLSSNVLEYMADHGLYIKVEYAMRSSLPKSREYFDDFSLYLENLLHSYPMLGLAVFDEQDKQTLFDLGTRASRKLELGNGQLTPKEQDALVMSTAQLLKDWRMDEEDDNSMWAFIYRQYGIREHEGNLSQKIYYGFQAAIELVTHRYKRFFAPPGTQRYYTTLMLHALAPKQSIHSLFEILVRFFENNLRSQYLPNDPSYKVFVQRIKTRWGVPSDLERLGLYSASMNSGLKTLFLNCSDYMATLCDSIVQKMDQLMRTGCLNIEKSENNYLDELLVGWYWDKSLAVRKQWINTQREMVGERTITNAKDTNPQYVLHQNRVALFIPNIRLPSAEGSLPRIIIHQGGQTVYNNALEVFGDDFSRTIRKTYLYLDMMPLRFHQALTLRVQIELGEILFDSIDRLYRPFLFFNQAGIEIRPSIQKTGPAYLFARESAELESLGLEEAYQLSHPGQLLEVQMDSLQDLRIDGIEIFLQASDKEVLRVYPSQSRIQGVFAQRPDSDYNIYANPVRFAVHVPETESPLSYLVQDGSELKPLNSFESSGDGVYILNPQSNPGEYRELSIKHFISSIVVFTHRFIHLPGFMLQYTQPFFLSGQAKVEGRYAFSGVDETFSSQLQGEETVPVSTNDGKLNLVLYPPLLRCSMLGIELFGNNTLFWHGDIPRDTYLSPVLPSGWQAAIALGNLTIETGANGSMDIGNQVSAYTGRNQKESLWFLLTSPQQERIPVQACEIVFKPTFRVPPLEASEGKLWWKTEDNYVGNAKSTFLVKLGRRKEHFADYSLTCKDEIVEQSFPFKVGLFNYEVYLVTQSLFSKTEELIYKGQFTLGDENALRFDGQEVELLTAICWNMDKKCTEDIKILNRAAVIRDIRYLGSSIPSGENTQYPEYEGVLQFYVHAQNEWQSFSDDEDSEEYEYINPVRFWPINDNMMIVYTCTEDGMNFDTSRNRLMYRKPDRVMHKSLQRAIITTPDYYAYRKDET